MKASTESEFAEEPVAGGTPAHDPVEARMGRSAGLLWERAQ